jgi:nicotinamidase-related amidase
MVYRRYRKKRSPYPMSQPKTLLALAGAPATPSPLENAVLLLIDCQMEYVTGTLPLSGVDDALGEAARLLELARSADVPVVHVAHHGRPGGALFDPEGAMVALAPQAERRAGEELVVKSLPNAFTGTNLQEVLDGLGRKEIIVAGFMTHMCVSSTVRAALDRGYRCTVVAGATATRDLPDGQGGVIGAADLQRCELAAMADRFAVVVDDSSAWAE